MAWLEWKGCWGGGRRVGRAWRVDGRGGAHTISGFWWGCCTVGQSIGPRRRVTPLPSMEGMPCRPPTQVQCVCRDMDTASSRGWRRVGCLVPRVGPSAGRSRPLLLTRTFPGLASGPSDLLKTAASFGWQPCGRPVALPGMTPGLCVAWGGVPKGETAGVGGGWYGERLSGWRPPCCALWDQIWSAPPRLASWSLVLSSLGAEPGCSLGPQSLILPFPELGTPSVSLSLLAPFRVLFDVSLVQ